MENTAVYSITYEFLFPSSYVRRYELTLDATHLGLQNNKSFSPPTWTQIEVAQCPICPLRTSQATHCPIAVNIAELVDHFKENGSTEPVTVKVITPERIYLKDTQIQYGLFSILGIIMATSGCPVMNFLKPMARFHLPFSTHTETMVRSISIYLLRQYFRKQVGEVPDLDLLELDRKYQLVQKVNDGILQRIRSVTGAEDDGSGDAQDNALLILHAFSQILSLEISDNLESLEYLFKED
ncbi:MAG TPA: hypothetical protein DCS07_06650 [Bdellovibrionales bacterium]|nr:MAG: hypothetical protein A2Z97_09175 [Bdellovibrionales bacterium GWB1_52_6]OFZ05411.1 MAG: hypothetical protein A2X97_11055 [Bdellovibrionales bacterium GWA1_52_35]OFZ32800.1 MAG: hypothetical protein A2070_12330 [Bdellovibrionales bacterium GWC1_52_8]HAR42297.1 hypothetical protein [Bdellovibrionales bacterium]HCM39229.1 hypothetical protein [Bdellovibrionales bacterium]